MQFLALFWELQRIDIGGLKLKCPKCGFENNNSAEFCSNCGAKLVKKDKNKRMLKIISILALIVSILCIVLWNRQKNDNHEAKQGVTG